MRELWLILTLFIASILDASEPINRGFESTHLMKGCVPAYEVMEPDTKGAEVFWFDLVIQYPNGTQARSRYTFATQLCCEQTHETVRDVVRQIVLAEHETIRMVGCR